MTMMGWAPFAGPIGIGLVRARQERVACFRCVVPRHGFLRSEELVRRAEARSVCDHRARTDLRQPERIARGRTLVEHAHHRRQLGTLRLRAHNTTTVTKPSGTWTTGGSNKRILLSSVRRAPTS